MPTYPPAGGYVHKLTKAELASELGVSVKSITRWSQRDVDPIPYIKIGGRKRFNASEVRAHFANNTATYGGTAG